LKQLIQDVSLSSISDKWLWLPDQEGAFLVKSPYDVLARDLVREEVLSCLKATVFKQICHSLAPSKTVSFSWQLLYDRIPTRSKLSRQSVTLAMDNPNCAWCSGCLEPAIHLLLHCHFAQCVWRGVFNLLRVDFLIPSNLFILFLNFYGMANNIKHQKGFLLIWQTTLWLIWKTE
jgi:hypothetical protein